MGAMHVQLQLSHGNTHMVATVLADRRLHEGARVHLKGDDTCWNVDKICQSGIPFRGWNNNI